MPKATRGRKSLFKLALFSATVLILLLVSVELIFRFVPPFDRFVTFEDALVAGKNRGPNAEFVYEGMGVGSFAEFKVRVTKNSLGFHEREYTAHKRDGVYRVLVLGDSVVEAKQVPLEKTFHELAERRFEHEGKAVEIIAMGRSGIGPKEAGEFYETSGRRFAPNLVVWVFTDVNDVTDSSPELRERMARHQQSQGGLQRPPEWLNSSVCVSFLWPRLSRLHASKSPTKGFFEGEFSKLNGLGFFDVVCLAHWPPLYEQARVRFEASTRALLEAVRHDGTAFIVLSFSGSYREWLPRLHPELDWDIERPERIVRGIVEETGGSFVTLKPRFTEMRRAKQHFIFPRDGHMNELGHQVTAETLHTLIDARLSPR